MRFDDVTPSCKSASAENETYKRLMIITGGILICFSYWSGLAYQLLTRIIFDMDFMCVFPWISWFSLISPVLRLGPITPELVLFLDFLSLEHPILLFYLRFANRRFIESIDCRKQFFIRVIKFKMYIKSYRYWLLNWQKHSPIYNLWKRFVLELRCLRVKSVQTYMTQWRHGKRNASSTKFTDMC